MIGILPCSAARKGDGEFPAFAAEVKPARVACQKCGTTTTSCSGRTPTADLSPRPRYLLVVITPYEGPNRPSCDVMLLGRTFCCGMASRTLIRGRRREFRSPRHL